jgi:hypothetical protein
MAGMNAAGSARVRQDSSGKNTTMATEKKKKKKKKTSRYVVHEAIVQIGTASELPDPWHNLAERGSFFDLRMPKKELLERLRE